MSAGRGLPDDADSLIRHDQSHCRQDLLECSPFRWLIGESEFLPSDDIKILIQDLVREENLNFAGSLACLGEARTRCLGGWTFISVMLVSKTISNMPDSLISALTSSPVMPLAFAVSHIDENALPCLLTFFFEASRFFNFLKMIESSISCRPRTSSPLRVPHSRGSIGDQHSGP